MSTVPPSPANPTTVAPFAPIAFSPDRRPEIDAPVASNALSRNGTVTQVLGNAPDITAQQHAGTVMIAPGPTPSSPPPANSASNIPSITGGVRPRPPRPPMKLRKRGFRGPPATLPTTS